MGLLRFLFGSSRDGKSPRTAIVVNSIAEEYQWMQQHYPGFQPDIQTLTYSDGKPHDALRWKNEKGEVVTVFFDISRFFGK
jgi:hypothetical protein